MTQLGIPSEVTPQEVAREKTFGGAIALCAKAAGLEPKQVMDSVRTSEGKPVDKAAWSRWVNDNEGIEWPKLVQIMDRCGNDAPLLWAIHARGYDINSIRRRESETERELRLTKERLAAVEAANLVLVNAMNGRAVA
jgi:hypothetical protein